MYEVELHKVLFHSSSRILGEFHWYLQKADTLTDDLMYIKDEDGTKKNPVELTPFGREILLPDPISWWINKNEINIKDLKEKTMIVKSSAEILKKSVYELRDNYEGKTYSDLINTIKSFATSNKEHILKLYEYARYLYLKNPMAPIILFSHPPWATTDLFERSIRIIANNIQEEKESRLNLCIETALGLSYQYRPTIEHTHSWIASEIADSIDPEYGYSINVPKDRLYSRTQKKVVNQLYTYFLNIREAIRIILERINNYEKSIQVMFKQDFWLKIINEVILASNRVEDDLFDVKESLDMWDAPTKDSRRKGKVEFAKSVATFANFKGGTIFIGISNKRELKGLSDIENKIKDISSVIKNLTTRKSSDFIKIVALKMKKDSKKRKLIVLLIAQTHDEIGVVEKSNGKKYIFPVRVGAGLIEDDYNVIKQRKEKIHEDNFRFILDLKEYIN